MGFLRYADPIPILPYPFTAFDAPAAVSGRLRVSYPAMPEPRFPPPWSVDDPDTKLGPDHFIVREQAGARLHTSRARCWRAVGGRVELFAWRMRSTSRSLK